MRALTLAAIVIALGACATAPRPEPDAPERRLVPVLFLDLATGRPCALEPAVAEALRVDVCGQPAPLPPRSEPRGRGV